jgi:hypothetical protein
MSEGGDMKGPTPGSYEFAMADIAEMVAAEERERKAREDRARARALFEAAGKPIPAWAREPGQ